MTMNVCPAALQENPHGGEFGFQIPCVWGELWDGQICG